jgi:hypothetical protein
LSKGGDVAFASATPKRAKTEPKRKEPMKQRRKKAKAKEAEPKMRTRSQRKSKLSIDHNLFPISFFGDSASLNARLMK